MKSRNTHLTTQYLSKFKTRELIQIYCDLCRKSFTRRKNNVLYQGHKNIFCSHACSNKACTKSKMLECAKCSTKIKRSMSELKKHKNSNSFCSSSCAAIYNNTHKTHGTRISKLEKWIKNQLTILYPNLDILYNNKTIINSELDIYIPSFKLAFELNGIFHYESIFGKEKLAQIQNNDDRKFQACLENNIELCIIDASNQKYFKPKTSQKYLDIITNIINTKK